MVLIIILNLKTNSLIKMSVTLYNISCIYGLCLTDYIFYYYKIAKISWIDMLWYTVDPYYFERNGLYIGQGTTMLSRAGIFRASQGIAIDMNSRVFKLPSFHGIVLPLSKTCRNAAMDLWNCGLSSG